MKHGHVTPNPDGSVARCGGPALCSVCARELANLNRETLPSSSTDVELKVPTFSFGTTAVIRHLPNGRSEGTGH